VVNFAGTSLFAADKMPSHLLPSSAKPAIGSVLRCRHVTACVGTASAKTHWERELEVVKSAFVLVNEILKVKRNIAELEVTATP
jgi:hypothetical protein